jgi:hypothetical protein
MISDAELDGNTRQLSQMPVSLLSCLVCVRTTVHQALSDSGLLNGGSERQVTVTSADGSPRTVRVVDTPNVLLTSWVASQRDLLSHPGVTLFISHCGHNSVFESLSVCHLFAGTRSVLERDTACFVLWRRGMASTRLAARMCRSPTQG